MSQMKDKIPGGVFAINKPAGISSAQVIRDMQTQFNPSSFFAPYMQAERQSRAAENSYQQRRRSRAKKAIQVKIGHGGTLDPMATGVLITGIGRGTKLLPTFLECTKSYEAVVLFGVGTDTYDRMGKIIGRKPFEHITKERVEDALSKYRGKIMQRPPIFSALRQNGKRLYEYAREGLELPKEIQERPVEVLDLQLTEWMEGGTHDYQWPTIEAEKDEKLIAEKVLHFEDQEKDSSTSSPGHKRKLEEEPQVESKKPRLEAEESADIQNEESESKQVASASSEPVKSDEKPPAAKLRMTVTSGFYVRSLCHDLGEAVDSLAIMSDLVRTQQGEFELGKNVLEYGDLAKGEEVWAPQIDAMLDDWDARHKDP